MRGNEVHDVNFTKTNKNLKRRKMGGQDIISQKYADHCLTKQLDTTIGLNW